MNKELQNKTWSILPKEFKEEVKKYYRTLHEQYKDYDGLHLENAKAKVQERIVTLEYFFGIDNLTSDAEGEEMLMVSRKKVLEIYTQNKNEIIRENVSSSDKDCYETVNEVLKTLFSSKCLPDNVDSSKPNVDSLEPKPDEPKFKVGDELVWDKRIIVKVDEVYADGEYLVYSRVGNRYTVKESDLEPYTEPKAGFLHADGEVETSAPTFTDECKSQCKSKSRNLSQETANCDKHFDNILKDSLAKERRLNIAAMAMAGALANPNITKSCGDLEVYCEYIATQALYHADALIAECEKGGQE